MSTSMWLATMGCLLTGTACAGQTYVCRYPNGVECEQTIPCVTPADRPVRMAADMATTGSAAGAGHPQPAGPQAAMPGGIRAYSGQSPKRGFRTEPRHACVMREGGAPPAAASAGPSRKFKLLRPPQSRVLPSTPGGSLGPLPGHRPSGYRCATERQLWVQLSPCPSTYLPGVGESPAGPQPVRQMPLERQPFCQYLANGVSVGHGWGADRQASERKRLRRIALCQG